MYLCNLFNGCESYLILAHNSMTDRILLHLCKILSPGNIRPPLRCNFGGVVVSLILWCGREQKVLPFSLQVWMWLQTVCSIYGSCSGWTVRPLLTHQSLGCAGEVWWAAEVCLHLPVEISKQFI